MGTVKVATVMRHFNTRGAWIGFDTYVITPAGTEYRLKRRKLNRDQSDALLAAIQAKGEIDTCLWELTKDPSRI